MAALLIACLPVMAADERNMLNVRDGDIRSLIEAVSRATGKNFVVDPRVKGQVTVISSRPMDAEALYQTFLSILKVHDYAAVPSGKIIKILPAITARQSGQDDRSGEGEQMVTQVVSLNHVPAVQMEPMLRPLMPQDAHLAAYEPSNMLIVSDQASNVARLLQIIRRLDISSDDAIEITPLEHARAEEVVRALNSLKGPPAANAKGADVMLSADTRTNSVLLGGSREMRLKLRAAIAELDRENVQETDDSMVIRLKYEQAKHLAGILKDFGGSSGRIATADPNATASAGSGGDVTVLADDLSNTLIINAPPAVREKLRAVVRKLDVPRAQVLLEAIVAEVGQDLSKQLGVDLAAAGGHALLLSDFPTTLGASAASALAAYQNGMNPSGLPEGFVGGGRVVSNGETRFVGLLRALRSDARTNVLSTPSLVALDNQEAEIAVGQEVPFVTGSYASSTSGSNGLNPFQTIERKDVGLRLRFTPHVVDAGSVQLEIFQEVSSLASNTVSAADVITNKRTLQTAVMVESGQIIGLGGLVDQRQSETQQKVPALGSLPLVGNLFRGTRNTRNRQNLVVFIRTSVVNDPSALTSLSQQQYGTLQELWPQAANVVRDAQPPAPTTAPAAPVAPTASAEAQSGETKEKTAAVPASPSDKTSAAEVIPTPARATRDGLRPFGPRH